MIVLLLILSFPFCLFSQGYIPFPDSNATWRVINCRKNDTWPNINCVSYNSFEYRIDGDTIINNLTYSKVYNYPGVKRYFGAIREDSLKRIYFYGSILQVQYQSPCILDSVGEYLLYQFGLNVGDTVSLFKVCQNEPPREILSIDSIIIKGEKRLRYHISNPYLLEEEYWIEGIGSTAGLLGPYANEFENYWELYCFQQNEIIIWPDTIDECISPGNPPPISTREVEEKIKLKIYPNPTQSILHIENQSSNQQIENIQIFDLNGKNIIQNKQSPIITTELPRGIYFVQIEMGNGVMYRKKILKN